jgi:alkylation response protein AidB-like acyl-CoA dehydrogenase
VNFQHSAEHDMLRSSVAGTFARGGADTVAALADLGVFGLLIAPESGGSGLGLVEAAIVLQEAGRAGVGGSLAETLLMADPLCRAMPDLAPGILGGQVAIVAPVSGKLRRDGRRLRGGLTLQRPDEGDWIAAPVGAGTQVALVPAARIPSTPRARIEAVASSYRVDLDVAEGEVRAVTIEAFADRLAILRCAELLGAAEHCLALSVAYLKDREQFGQPIGANQALKHIAADTYLSQENIRVAVEYAAAARDAADANRSDVTLRVASIQAVEVMLAYVPRAAREIVETAIHLHGGIGLTWDYGLNAYLRRIVRLGMGLGAVSANQLAVFERFNGQGRPAEATQPSPAIQEVHYDRAV